MYHVEVTNSIWYHELYHGVSFQVYELYHGVHVKVTNSSRCHEFYHSV